MKKGDLLSPALLFYLQKYWLETWIPYLTIKISRDLGCLNGVKKFNHLAYADETILSILVYNISLQLIISTLEDYEEQPG